MANQLQRNTQSSNIFLDANVLLEIILSRKKEKAARNFLENNKHELSISALTGHLVIHFGQKIVELQVLERFLSDYNLLELNDKDFKWAFANIIGSDFEDALQVAVAIRNGCEEFVTFDEVLHRKYQKMNTIKVKLLN